jgi:hypothetical protein
MFRVSLFRAIGVSCLAAGLTVGCASTTPVTSGGYYCMKGPLDSCPEHEGNGDCQLCPTSSIASASGSDSLR